jgi:hypothetical protein
LPKTNIRNDDNKKALLIWPKFLGSLDPGELE